MPTVSVVLPVYNGAETIDSAVRSILSQTYRDFELVVINDGSTDDTSAVLLGIRDPRIRLFELEQNVGRSKARNLGISQARGMYFAMTDADDRSYPDRLNVQVSFMESHPEVAMCGTWAHVVEPSGSRLEWRQPTDPDTIKRTVLRSSPFIHCTVLVRKRVLEEIGGFDQTLEPAEDYDLYLRIAAKYPVANIPRVLAEYQAHGDLKYRLREQLAKLPVRWKAIFNYGYPRTQLIYLLTPFCTLLLPLEVKLYVKRRLLTTKVEK